MASTYTINLGFRKPEHRDPETVESWDAVINANWDLIDVAFGARSYTAKAQGAPAYLANADSHSLSLNKLAEALTDVNGLVPTATQFAALAGPGAGYSPTGANPYATINYVRISRKEVLSPEYHGAVFSPNPSGDNIGNMTSDSEKITVGPVKYRYNYYQWYSDEGTLQNYDIVMQWQVPSTFLGFNIVAGKALILDIRTDDPDPANCHVDIELHKDGTPDTDPSIYISKLLDKVTATDVWVGERQGPAVIAFSSTDPVLLACAAPGSILNIRISMNSMDSHVVKVGAITIQGTW